MQLEWRHRLLTYVFVYCTAIYIIVGLLYCYSITCLIDWLARVYRCDLDCDVFSYRQNSYLDVLVEKSLLYFTWRCIILFHRSNVCTTFQRSDESKIFLRKLKKKLLISVSNYGTTEQNIFTKSFMNAELSTRLSPVQCMVIRYW